MPSNSVLGAWVVAILVQVLGKYLDSLKQVGSVLCAELISKVSTSNNAKNGQIQHGGRFRSDMLGHD